MSSLSPSNSPAPAASELRFERRIVLGLVLLTLALTSLPYTLGYFIASPDQPSTVTFQSTTFIGTAYNIDDYCNYLSWLRQTMDGRFFFHNQFTTEPQRDLEFNVFFWLLGRLADFAHLSPQVALQAARVGGAIALLWLILCFYRAVLPDNPRARVTAFGFVCLSSGFGWLQWALWHDHNPSGSPVDAWQPEAFTFLTIYANTLMTVSTALIVGAMYALLRGEQTGQWKYAVFAGVCGAILGNMHSYDVLHIAAAWGVFLVVWTILQKGQGVGRSWGRALIALALTLPTTAYQYYIFQKEAVFHARAEVPTLTPAFWHYVIGYGLVFLLAVAAVAVTALRWQQQREDSASGSRWHRSLPFVVAVCWAIGGLSVIYLHFAFQRKMIMGTHIPLCLLAGIGAVALIDRWKISARWQTLILTLFVLLSMPTNLFFLKRDMTHLVDNRSETEQTPLLPTTLVNTYAWLRTHTTPDSAVVGFPPLCTPLPGYAGHTVWAGHWGETPQYQEKFHAFIRFADVHTADPERQAFLATTDAQYLLYPNDVSHMVFRTSGGETVQFADLAHAPVSGTTVVYANHDYTVFRISRP